MTPFRLALHREAIHSLTRLDTRTFRQVALRMLRLVQDPRPHDSEELKGARAPEGQRPLFRVDQGEYRIVYAVDYDNRLVTIFRIGHRKDVSRGLN